jgi:hypothetical protein
MAQPLTGQIVQRDLPLRDVGDERERQPHALGEHAPVDAERQQQHGERAAVRRRAKVGMHLK